MVVSTDAYVDVFDSLLLVILIQKRVFSNRQVLWQALSSPSCWNVLYPVVKGSDYLLCAIGSRGNRLAYVQCWPGCIVMIVGLYASLGALPRNMAGCVTNGCNLTATRDGSGKH